MLGRFAFLALGLAALTASNAHARLDKAADFEVLTYEIGAQPDFERKTMYVGETIRFKSLVEGLETISFSTSASKTSPPDFNDEVRSVETVIIGDRCIFRLPRPMALGEVARISFSFQSTPKGAIFGKDTVYANYFTCDVIVCDQDRTSDKATIDFGLHLLPGLQAVAPGRLVLHHEFPGKWNQAVWRWHEARPTSPYLLGFAAGRFHRTRLTGRHPRLIVLSQSESAARVRVMFRDTRRMLRFFEQKSGVRYDEAAYTQVLVDGDEAQEVARHSIIGKDEIEPILKDPQEDWVIAHELAHQWWGNSLTCADWSELWLNEGFTVFMVAAYKEQRWGRAAYDRELELAHKRWDAAKAQNFDVPLSWQGEYPSLKLKRAMAYAKAVVFLDKLRRDLGDETFWRAIKTYTIEHRDGVVTATDLEDAFEAASGKNLAPLFAEWVFGPAAAPRDTP